jgi:hypothetical protein
MRRHISNISQIPRGPVLVALCGGVWVVVKEMYAVALGAIAPYGREKRRALRHIRQIAMYVCHVVLQIPMKDIAGVYGFDRTTVGHACRLTEDRRDDRAYDEFVAAIERVVEAAFGLERLAERQRPILLLEARREDEPALLPDHRNSGNEPAGAAADDRN